MFSLLTRHFKPQKLNNPNIYSGGFIVELRGTQNTELLISTILHAAVQGSVTYGCQLVKKWKLRSIHNLPRGWATMILRGGVTLFPYYDLGGAVENFQRNLHRA